MDLVSAVVSRWLYTRLTRTLTGRELVSPEYEASFEFLRRVLSVFGWKKTDQKQALAMMRQDEEIAEFSPEEEA